MNHSSIPEQQVPAVLSGCRILIVDDSRTHRKLVESSLRQAGFHRITSAADGRQAVEMVLAEPPDLVLLDIVMPILDGFGVCKALRARPEYADLPILVMTSLESVEHRLRALSVGATDVILKPVYQPQLVAHTVSHLERRRLLTGLREYQDRIATELDIARQMQEALLPDTQAISTIHDRYGIDIAALFEPSAELGGDLWGMWPIDASRVGLFVGDVSGHGTIAAINTFRIHTLLGRSDIDRSDPSRFLSFVNDSLAPLLSPGQYVTMIYAVIDTRRDMINFAAAGSPEPILSVPSSSVTGLDGSGVPLGIVAGNLYPTRNAPFPPGAAILFHSDALTEARLRADGTLLGEERARQFVTAALEAPASDKVISDLRTTIRQVAYDPLDDDLTLICIRRQDVDLGHATSSVAVAADSTMGRVLVVARTLSQRLIVKRAALHAGLAADIASDLASAGRFMAGANYLVMVIDMELPAADRLELLRIAAGVESRPRLLLAGANGEELFMAAASLGLEVAAVLPVPMAIPTIGAALLSGVATKTAGSDTEADVVITAEDLNNALANNEITFSFQPQIALATRQIMGAETLARWMSPVHGVVPGSTLSVIVDSGTALLLADATLNAAITACAAWRIVSPRMRVAVNLSAASLTNRSLIDLVVMRLREGGMSPAALIVEVTELDAHTCGATLAALAGLGVGIALDDFGSGDIGLQALESLPVGMLKLSRSVVRKCETDPRATRMLNVTIAVARTLGMTVGAVGIETYTIEQTLRSAGVDIAQGWLYGPALSASAITDLMSA